MKERAQDSGFGEPYLHHARTLRNWFVAYGIGVPALFLANATLADRLRGSPRASLVIGLFLFGVLVQVVNVLLFKSVMWYRHYGELLPSFKNTVRHRMSEAISDWLWLELLFDSLTILGFGWATALLFFEFLQPASKCAAA